MLEQIVVKQSQMKAKFFFLSHDVLTCDIDRDIATAYCSLLQAMRLTDHAWSYKHDALLWLVVFQQLWLVHFDPYCFTQFSVRWNKQKNLAFIVIHHNE